MAVKLRKWLRMTYYPGYSHELIVERKNVKIVPFVLITPNHELWIKMWESATLKFVQIVAHF